MIALEHTRMWPGVVGASLVAWQEAVLIGTADRVVGRCLCEECTGDAPRRRLHRALTALPSWAGPYLYGLVLPIDHYYLSRTAPNPYAPPDRPWWQRRLIRPG
ncbi:hypothetical protein [Nonomuraea solani]|uniref:hypothetical protein n=1 Tax=Nonomuraea solani TaxID=1144553 RepID=UPI0011AFF42B|nr:hypothetical protein [Nonomuraea solani]